MSTFAILDWYLNDNYPDAQAMLGRIPLLLDPACTDPAWMQFRDNLGHWNPEPPGWWDLGADDTLHYPGLPPVMPAAVAMLRQEKIMVYPAGWVVIAQPNGEYTVARIQP